METPIYNLENAELKNNKAVYQGEKLDELQGLNIFLYVIYYVSCHHYFFCYYYFI